MVGSPQPLIAVTSNSVFDYMTTLSAHHRANLVRCIVSNQINDLGQENKDKLFP